jgi:hypothetical protein
VTCVASIAQSPNRGAVWSSFDTYNGRVPDQVPGATIRASIVQIPDAQSHYKVFENNVPGRFDASQSGATCLILLNEHTLPRAQHKLL